MKTSRFPAVALAIVTFLFLAFTARAQTPQPPNQQTANGTATAVLNQTGPANDSFNGEFGGGGGNGTYTVTDSTNASGNAATIGTATGSNTGPVISINGTTITTTAVGNAQSTMSTLTSGTGANTSVNISASAEQSSWSGTTVDPNALTFANASEYTYGGYIGNGSGNGTVGQSGIGNASGENSASTINVNGLNVTSTFKTTGLSNAAITATSTDPAASQQISTIVSGGLAANGASFAGNPSTSTFASAYGIGGANYYGTSTTGTLQGAGQVSGQNNATVAIGVPNQTSVSASSVIASTAQVK
jgi:hypothetical protein